MSKKKNRKRSVDRTRVADTNVPDPPKKATKRRAARRQRAAQKRRQQIISGGLVVAAIAVLGGWFATRSAAEPVVPPERLALVAFRGAQDASVTLTEYGDFNCPSCKAWHTAGIFDQILAQFAGQVRYEFPHFPVITPRSPKLAEAAECAHDQGKFWELHDLLYEFAPTSSTNVMKDFARQIGVEQTQFDECLDSGLHEATVREHQNQAFSIGFRGTPAFTINGQPLVNPSPEMIINIIEQALVASG